MSHPLRLIIVLRLILVVIGLAVPWPPGGIFGRRGRRR